MKLPMSLRVLVAALMVSSCTSRNPAFCGDGVCIDPARPFCDQDGSLKGTPNTCVTIDCEPASFVVCRGDQSLTCSASGNDLDTTECPLGCDPSAAGCRQCTNNTQCSNTSPICDAGTSACRACKTDDECDSKVCDFATGSCVAETSVVYAAANSSFGACSLAEPCPLNNAITLAANASLPPIVRMLPGTYGSSIHVSNPTAMPLRVVATGATIALADDIAAIVVDSGASVDIRNLTSTSKLQVQCGGSSGAISSLSLHDSTLTAVGIGTQIDTQRCDLTLTHMDLAFASANTLIGTHDDSAIDLDRVHAHGNQTSAIVFAGSRNNVRITNSLLDDVQLVSFTSDSSPPGTSLTFAFDTFVQRTSNSSHTICNGGVVTNRHVSFENTISAPLQAFDAFQSANPANCSFSGTILQRQSNTLAGTTIVDPGFVDTAGGDFHLAPGSPAVDAAVPAAVTSISDLDGVSRPQGGSSDIGAYERAP